MRDPVAAGGRSRTYVLWVCDPGGHRAAETCLYQAIRRRRVVRFDRTTERTPHLTTEWTTERSRRITAARVEPQMSIRTRFQNLSGYVNHSVAPIGEQASAGFPVEICTHVSALSIIGRKWLAGPDSTNDNRCLVARFAGDASRGIASFSGVASARYRRVAGVLVRGRRRRLAFISCCGGGVRGVAVFRGSVWRRFRRVFYSGVSRCG